MAQTIEWDTWNDARKSITRKTVHSFIGPLSIKCRWNYCSRCGLILLKNEISYKSSKRRCEYIDGE